MVVIHLLLAALLRSTLAPADIPLGGVGFPLEAQWHTGETWYRARAALRQVDGTYDIRYSDGDRWERTPRSKIRLNIVAAAAPNISPRDTSPPDAPAPACSAGRFLAEAVGVANSNSSCLAWRQTRGCRSDGQRESAHDRTCAETIEDGSSGYCECAILPQAQALAARAAERRAARARASAAAAFLAGSATLAQPLSTAPPPPATLTAVHGGVACSHPPLRCATACPPAGTQICMDCPKGRYSLIAEPMPTTAPPCAPWPPCPAGTERSGASSSAAGACRACPHGQFKARADAKRSGAPWGPLRAPPSCTAWLRCGAGEYVFGGGANVTYGGRCAPCSAGRFSRVLPVAPTTAAPSSAPLAAPGGSATGCILCPGGQYQPRSRASSCTGCAAGRHRDARGGTSAASCMRCAPGRFANLASAVACGACPAGKYRAQTAASLAADHGQRFRSGMACSACPSGKYQPGGAGAVQAKWQQAQAAAKVAQTTLATAQRTAAEAQASARRADVQAKAAKAHAASLMMRVHGVAVGDSTVTKAMAAAAAAAASASLNDANMAEAASQSAAAASAKQADAARGAAIAADAVTAAATAAAKANAPVRCLPCGRGWHSLRSASQCWPCPSQALQQRMGENVAAEAPSTEGTVPGSLLAGRLADVGVEGCASGALGGGESTAPPALLVLDAEGWGQVPSPPLQLAMDIFIGTPTANSPSKSLAEAKWVASARVSLGGDAGQARASAKCPYMINLDELGHKEHGRRRRRRRRRRHENLASSNNNSKRGARFGTSLAAEERVAALEAALVSSARPSHWSLEAPYADKSLGRGALGRLLAAATAPQAGGAAFGMASIVPRAFPVEVVVLNTEGGAAVLAAEELAKKKGGMAAKNARARHDGRGRRSARHGRRALLRAMRRSSARATANAETDPNAEQWWRWPEYRGAFDLVEDEAEVVRHQLPSASASTVFALRVIEPPPPSSSRPTSARNRGLDGGGERILRTWLTGLPLATGATAVGGTDGAQPAAADAVPKRSSLGEMEEVAKMLDDVEGKLFAPLPGRCWPSRWGRSAGKSAHADGVDDEELPPSAAEGLDWNAFIEHFLLAELSATGQPASVRWRPLLFTRNASDATVSSATTGGGDRERLLIAVGLPSGLAGGFGVLGTRLLHAAAGTKMGPRTAAPKPDSAASSGLALDAWAYQSDLQLPERPLADANDQENEGFGNRYEQRNARMAARREALGGGAGQREYFTPQLAYWYQRLLAIPEFAAKLARRWRQLRRGDGNGGEGPWADDALRELAGRALRWHTPETAQRNFVRWPVLGGLGPWTEQPSSSAAAAQAASALRAMSADAAPAAAPGPTDAGGTFGASLRAVRDAVVARARWMDSQLLDFPEHSQKSKLRELHHSNARAGAAARFQFGGLAALCRYAQAPAIPYPTHVALSCPRPGLKMRAFDLNPASYLRAAAAAVAAAKEAASGGTEDASGDQGVDANDASLSMASVTQAVSTVASLKQELSQMRSARGALAATTGLAASAAVAAATSVARSGMGQVQRLGLTDVLQPLGSRVFTGRLLWNDSAAMILFASQNSEAAVRVGDNHHFPFARGDVRHALEPLLPWAARNKLAKEGGKATVHDGAAVGGGTAGGAALLSASTWLLSQPNPGGLLWSGGLEGVAKPAAHESSRWRKVHVGGDTDRRLSPDITAATGATTTGADAATDSAAAHTCVPYLSAVLAIQNYSRGVQNSSEHEVAAAGSGGWGSSTSGVSALAYSENAGATPISEIASRAFDGSKETKFLQFTQAVPQKVNAAPGRKPLTKYRLRAKPDTGSTSAGSAQERWVGLGLRFDAVLDGSGTLPPPAKAVLRRPVHAYTVTSADDSPARDPAGWVVEAWIVPLEVAQRQSRGRWVLLDRRSGVRFAGRGTTSLFCTAGDRVTMPPPGFVFGAFRLRVSAVLGSESRPGFADAFQVAEWALLHCGGRGKQALAVCGTSTVDHQGGLTNSAPLPPLTVIRAPGQEVAAALAHTRQSSAAAAAMAALRKSLRSRCALHVGAQLASWAALRHLAEAPAGRASYVQVKLGARTAQLQLEHQLVSASHWLGMNTGPPLGALVLEGSGIGPALLILHNCTSCANITSATNATGAGSGVEALWSAVCVNPHALKQAHSLVRAPPKQLQLPTTADELAWRRRHELRRRERSAAAAAVGFPMRLLGLALATKSGTNPALRFDGLLTLPLVGSSANRPAQWRLRVEALDHVWVWLDGVLLIDTGSWPAALTEAGADKRALARLSAAGAEAQAEAQARADAGGDIGEGETVVPFILGQRVWQTGQGVQAAMQISWNWMPTPAGSAASLVNTLARRLRVEVLYDRDARRKARLPGHSAKQHWLGLGLMWQRVDHRGGQSPWEVIPASALTHWPDPSLPSGAAVDCPPPTLPARSLSGPHRCAVPLLTWQERLTTAEKAKDAEVATGPATAAPEHKHARARVTTQSSKAVQGGTAAAGKARPTADATTTNLVSLLAICTLALAVRSATSADRGTRTGAQVPAPPSPPVQDGQLQRASSSVEMTKLDEHLGTGNFGAIESAGSGQGEEETLVRLT